MKQKKDVWFSVKIRVRLPEVDAMGIVYHAAFFTYLEVALQEYIRNIRKTKLSFQYPLGFPNVVAHVSCDYRSPAFFDDLLTIQTKISRIGNKSLTVVFRVLDNATKRLVAEGERVHVAIDSKTRRPVPLGVQYRKLLS